MCVRAVLCFTQVIRAIEAKDLLFRVIRSRLEWLMTNSVFVTPLLLQPIINVEIVQQMTAFWGEHNIPYIYHWMWYITFVRTGFRKLPWNYLSHIIHILSCLLCFTIRPAHPKLWCDLSLSRLTGSYRDATFPRLKIAIGITTQWITQSCTWSQSFPCAAVCCNLEHTPLSVYLGNFSKPERTALKPGVSCDSYNFQRL